MSWDGFVDYYLGQVGLMPNDFYQMTLKEVTLKGESWRIQQNLDWERTRFLSTISKNAGLVARGGAISKLQEPRELFPLPQDKVVVKYIGKPKSTVDQFKSFFEKAKGLGTKFDKTPDFEKLNKSHK